MMMLWSIRSKALEKSIMHARTRWVSEEESQWCKRWISRCVVEQPLINVAELVLINCCRYDFIYPLENKTFQDLTEHGRKRNWTEIFTSVLWIIDFRQGENVCTFPERWDLALSDRCIENWANWSGKYAGVSFQYPVWCIVRTYRFLGVNARTEEPGKVDTRWIGEKLSDGMFSATLLKWVCNVISKFLVFYNIAIEWKAEQDRWIRETSQWLNTFPPFCRILIHVCHRFIEESASLRAHFLNFVAIIVVS